MAILGKSTADAKAERPQTRDGAETALTQDVAAKGKEERKSTGIGAQHEESELSGIRGRQRAIIEAITPQVDGGRFAAKRTLGDVVRVECDVFTDGHDSVAGVVRYRHEDAAAWSEVPLEFLDNDRWFATFPVIAIGRYRYTVEAWVDGWQTWRKDLLKRIAADSDTDVDYQIGAVLIAGGSARSQGSDSIWLGEKARDLRQDADKEVHRQTATSPALNDLMLRYPDREHASTHSQELELVVDPIRARYSAWYELFPRSTSEQPGRHGTFADVEARLPYVASMGFDVLYLPPIHPIGRNFRKGKNNTVTAEANDVGSPWAIGSEEGGHKAIHPQLGSYEDFLRLVRRAGEYGMQVAMDIAFQVAPDHPYVKEHENWFRKRPDGTIQYAENPPKKYQDIYPFDFESEDWSGMWAELKSVFDYWIEAGVRIFRVDNPHTKAFGFWEWCITAIKRDHPDVLFLSEAFTRPKVMYRLAKLGFSWSYTYFPWRTGGEEIREYLETVTTPPVVDFFRANQWPNTPDILTAFLQQGTRPSFAIRYLLAATLGASYGIYGPAFELQESHPIRPGSEEYLDSEKYQIRNWNLNRSDSLRDLIALVNRIRRENEALQDDRGILFHDTDNPQLVCYSKHNAMRSNLVVMITNLDPHNRQSGFVDLRLDLLDIPDDQPFVVHDLLTGANYTWSGSRNYVELNPHTMPAHILQLRRVPRG